MKFSTPISGFDLREFTPDMMIALCVGAGCDYLVRTYYNYVVLCCVVLCCVVLCCVVLCCVVLC